MGCFLVAAEISPLVLINGIQKRKTNFLKRKPPTITHCQLFKQMLQHTHTYWFQIFYLGSSQSKAWELKQPSSSKRWCRINPFVAGIAPRLPVRLLAGDIPIKSMECQDGPGASGSTAGLKCADINGSHSLLHAETKPVCLSWFRLHAPCSIVNWRHFLPL